MKASVIVFPGSNCDRAAVSGVALPATGEPGLTLTGTLTPGPQLEVVPRLVLQDRDGLRTRHGLAW